MLLSPNEAAWCLLEAGFTGDEIPKGVAVGWAESELNTEARGYRSLTDTAFRGNMDLGWLQISNYYHYAKLLKLPDWRDPLWNARLARLVYLEKEKIQASKGEPLDGWKAWATYLGTRYTQALPFGTVGIKALIKPPGVRDLMHSELAKLRLELAA